MALFIGIDLGTSGCRAIAIDEHGEILGNATTTLPEPIRKDNRVEQDSNIWWEAVCTCLTVLTKQINNNEVIAIAVDGTSASLLLVDKNGNPLYPALMYNDARAIRQADIISNVAPPNTAAQGATCALAKLLWLYEEGLYEEELYKKEENNKTRYAMHQADWISAKLCNQFGSSDYVYSDYNNALKLGFDAELKTWPSWVVKLLEDAGVPLNILPKVVRPGVTIGTISPELAAKFNLPTEINIIAGTTDSTASFMATGASNEGEAVTSLGSTLVLKIISDKPVFAPEYGVYSQPLFNRDGERWLVGGASNSGGAVLKQFFSDEQIKEMTPKLNPDSLTGLKYYPLPASGERFPVCDAQLEPRLEPRPENDVLFFQGMLEGIANIEAEGYRLLAELGAPYPVSVRTTGGGASNPAWTRIRTMMLKSNNSQTEIIDAMRTEAAYGSALLAHRACTD